MDTALKNLNTGAYNLVMSLGKDSRIKIGELGLIEFKKGYYVYTGSAMNNLDKRVSRHLSNNKKMHWHIDYFLKHAKVIKVKKYKCNVKQECDINKIFLDLGQPIKKFGCSDCRCVSHLVYFKKLE